LSDLNCTTVQRTGNWVPTECYNYRMKRTMSLIDEFNAATQSLDRILEKMEEADPADKERLEAYVKSMQVKVQQILKAILRVH
jgi:glutamate racemase